MFRKFVFLLSIFCAVTLAVTAQTSPASPKPGDPPILKGGQPPSQQETPDQPLVPTMASAPDDDAEDPNAKGNVANSRYRLQPSDVIDVRYVYSPEYDRKGVVVQPDGFISLEIAGNLRVAGLTIDEVREKIRARASRRLNEPEVLVILTDFVKPYFVVAGEVPTPGRLDLRENTTALQAVLLAGGFKDTAKSSQIILFRRYNADLVETKVIKLEDLKRDEKVREDIVLRSGDMIFVPRNTITKIERYARLASVASIFGFLIP